MLQNALPHSVEESFRWVLDLDAEADEFPDLNSWCLRVCVKFGEDCSW